MKKLVSVLLVLMLTLTVAAAEEATTEEAATPSITLPAITKPVVTDVVVTDNNGEEVDKPIVIEPVEEEKDEESKAFMEKVEQELNKLAELKTKQQETAKTEGVEVKKNAYIYEFFADASVTTKAAAAANIETEEKVVTEAVVNTTNEAGDVVQETKTVETAAVTLEEIVTEVFGEETELVMHEFTPMTIEGYDETVHDEVNVTMQFTAEYTQEKVIVMVGSYDANGTLVWSTLVCDVVDGMIKMSLDAETLKLVNEGKAIVSVLSAAA